MNKFECENVILIARITGQLEQEGKIIICYLPSFFDFCYRMAQQFEAYITMIKNYTSTSYLYYITDFATTQLLERYGTPET